MKPINPKATMEVQQPQLRTPEAMKQDSRRRPPVLAALGTGDPPVEPTILHAPVSGGKRRKPFLPTTDATAYHQHKAKLREKGPAAVKPTLKHRSRPESAAKPAPAPAILIGPDIEGAGDVDRVMPPATHGAVGLDEFVETTNMHIDVFQKSDPSNRASIPLNSFFGYWTQPLFDARVAYDSTWNRWIITAEAFPESPTVQYHFIAVSTTPSAFGSFFIYALNVSFNQGDFWDYPQLGMDQDSIIITANIFDASGNYAGADMFAVAKARLYNGLGFSVFVFTGLVGTLAPPIVLDQNPKSFLIAAPGGNALKLYELRNSSRTGVSLTGPMDVPVDAYEAPPSALQTGTYAMLDTLDGRFVNASTQVGDSLWQVHTVNLVGYAAPKFYQINTATNSCIQSGFFFASRTSFDFNASIAANDDNDVFLTWSSTDPPAGINAQARFSACDHHDGPCVPGAGTPVFTSSTFFAGGRWGDHSAVTVDPATPRRAWLVNEVITATGDWGSRIDGIGL